MTTTTTRRAVLAGAIAVPTASAVSGLSLAGATPMLFDLEAKLAEVEIRE
jgi:hypothetical protein